MHSILRRLLVLATAAGIVVSASASAPRHAVSPGAPAAPQKLQFTADQLEYYLDEGGIAYLRPGLNVQIVSVTNVASGQKPVVELRFTDDLGQPLDRLGANTPGKISGDFILAMWNPNTSEYVNLNVAHFGNVSYPLHDIGGTWTDLEMGHAKFTFALPLPSGIDPAQTYTVGVYSGRDTKEMVGKEYAAPAVVYTFRPDGATASAVFDKINIAACNACHDPLAFHSQFSGQRINDVKVCVLCHTSQMPTFANGQTLDFRVLIHRLHDASNLPSVKAGGTYAPVPGGEDFTTVGFPQDIRNCSTCHAGSDPTKIPTQSNAWYSNPTRAACGSCHDDINWTTGANHPAGPMADDKACAVCHTPDSGKEFDASIKGAHTIPTKSKQLKGLSVAIANVSNFKAGQKPTVAFAIKNGDGSVVDGTKLTSFAPIFAGPTGSYSTYYREAAQAKATFDSSTGLTTYTFTNALPADASGTWTVSADTYRSVQLLKADGTNLPGGPIREAAMNPIQYVALTGTVTPRRKVVALANCLACHESLGLHGGQRQTTEECVICHNPTEGDQARRPADQGAKESVSFQRLIHRIHSGENLTQDFTIYGYGGSRNNFNDVRFPGDTRNCSKCHVNNSYTLPVATSAASVTTLRDYFSPQGPGTAACLGCHDNKDAAAHAYLNTTTFPGANAPQEACATCHGTGKDWDAAKVHAR